MKYQQTLIELIKGDSALMNCLHQAEQLQLASWCIGAGAIRNMVWDTLHNFKSRTPLNDIDVVYFDNSDLSVNTEKTYLAKLQSLAPNQPWEVVNQARVHLWYPKTFGIAVSPITSLENGLATWPETATCVGAYIQNGNVQIIAPFGLQDLFELKLRHSPTRASLKLFDQRLTSKAFQSTWPQLTVIGSNSGLKITC